MEEKVKVSILLELYGAVLTEKQQEFMDWYYNQDLSLSEIAENEGITRQAVNKVLIQTKKKLEEYEQKLNFMKKNETLGKLIKQLENTKNSKEQEKIIKNIKKQIEL